MLRKILTLVLSAIVVLGMNATDIFANNLKLRCQTLMANQKEKCRKAEMKVVNFTPETSYYRLNENIFEKNIVENFSKNSTNNQQLKAITLTDKYGILKGTLTQDKNIEIYFFSKDEDFLFVTKLLSQNTNYFMVLGIVDDTKNHVALTNHVVGVNQQYAINLDAGKYVWVVAAKNQSYEKEFEFQYNMSLPRGTSDIIYFTNDYQKIYTLGADGILKLNGKSMDASYIHTIDWKVKLPSGEDAWHKEHVWLKKPKLDKLVHIGGFKYKYGTKEKIYPNVLVFTIGVGGEFTHYLDQNPPRIFHNYNDVAGRETPRTIDESDINNFGPHFLVYDLSTGFVEEFVSPLSREWSSAGDKRMPYFIP